MSDNIYIGIVDSYGGWLHGVVYYYDGDDVVGYVNYQLNNNKHEIYIDMIKVDDNYKRQGIATKMLYRLRDEYKDYYVDWGMTTPDGTKLYNKLCKTELNPEYENIQKALETCQTLLDDCESKLNNDEWLENSSQQQIDKVGHLWEKLYDKKRDLEDKLEDMRQYITVWR